MERVWLRVGEDGKPQDEQECITLPEGCKIIEMEPEMMKEIFVDLNRNKINPEYAMHEQSCVQRM